MTEVINFNKLTISVNWTRCWHILANTGYTNEDPKQAPELNDMELSFINSSNDIIYGGLNKILPDNDKVSGEIEPEKNIKYSDTEISEDDGDNTKEYENIKSDVRS